MRQRFEISGHLPICDIEKAAIIEFRHHVSIEHDFQRVDLTVEYINQLTADGDPESRW